MKRMLIFTLILVVGIGGMVMAEEENCITCHKSESPGLHNQWANSKHADNDVTCLGCHEADEGDTDGFDHNGSFIATLVTPKDCANCHEQEAAEVMASYHATAGEILDSKDAYLAHVAGGEQAAMTGCESCHGTKVIIDPESPNMLSKKSWPNSGIGRINPDGSKGSCTACHGRHSFDAYQARKPEACSKCHLGPDHPQKEIFEASKHGNAYYTHLDEMNIKSEEWVVGVDYYEAPTCATCHMSATTKRPITHDVGERLSWTLRPPVSVRKDNWEAKKESMMTVCTSCHSSTFAEGHYYQYDGLVHLYNEKFGKPATAIMKKIRELKLLENPAAFSNDIEWTYWEIWHHEGRRARHGAAMMGPDYTWWHGMYEVAKHFYFKFIPEARDFKNAELDAMLDELMADPMHNWLGETTSSLKERIRSGEMQKIYESLHDMK